MGREAAHDMPVFTFQEEVSHGNFDILEWFTVCLTGQNRGSATAMFSDVAHSIQRALTRCGQQPKARRQTVPADEQLITPNRSPTFSAGDNAFMQMDRGVGAYDGRERLHAAPFIEMIAQDISAAYSQPSHLPLQISLQPSLATNEYFQSAITVARGLPRLSRPGENARLSA